MHLDSRLHPGLHRLWAKANPSCTLFEHVLEGATLRSRTGCYLLVVGVQMVLWQLGVLEIFGSPFWVPGRLAYCVLMLP